MVEEKTAEARLAELQNQELLDEASYQTFLSFYEGLSLGFFNILSVKIDELTENSHKKAETLISQFTTYVCLPFSGAITGELFLCLNIPQWRQTVADFTGVAPDDPILDELLRSTFLEILNTAGGEAVSTVKQFFGSVTLLSPRMVEGKIFYPKTEIYTCTLGFEGREQLVELHLSLDLMEQEINVEHERLKQNSKLDDTGLYNKKYFQSMIARVGEAYRDSGYFSVIYADINRLKYVNDTYGHEAGDSYIQAACDIIKKSCRFSDFCFRVGGDELVVILPKCPKEDTVYVMNRIKDLSGKWSMQVKNKNGDSEILRIHLSVGSASNSEGLGVDKVVAKADERMEEDKRKWYADQNFDRRT